jgi:hypothetical protein
LALEDDEHVQAARVLLVPERSIGAGPNQAVQWIALPNRGHFAVGRATIETYDPEHHFQVVPALRVD